MHGMQSPVVTKAQIYMIHVYLFTGSQKGYFDIEIDYK